MNASRPTKGAQMSPQLLFIMIEVLRGRTIVESERIGADTIKLKLDNGVEFSFSSECLCNKEKTSISTLYNDLEVKSE